VRISIEIEGQLYDGSPGRYYIEIDNCLVPDLNEIKATVSKTIGFDMSAVHIRKAHEVIVDAITKVRDEMAGSPVARISGRLRIED